MNTCRVCRNTVYDDSLDNLCPACMEAACKAYKRSKKKTKKLCRVCGKRPVNPPLFPDWCGHEDCLPF